MIIQDFGTTPVIIQNFGDPYDDTESDSSDYSLIVPGAEETAQMVAEGDP